MADDTTLEDLVAQLGQTMGMSAFGLDDDGAAALSFDDKIVVNIRRAPEGEGYSLVAPLGRIREDRRLEIFADLLKANHSDSGLGEGALALDATGEMVVLVDYRKMDALSYVEFEKLIESFAGTAEAWIDYLAQREAEAGSADPTSGPNFGIRV